MYLLCVSLRNGHSLSSLAFFDPFTPRFLAAWGACLMPAVYFTVESPVRPPTAI